MNDNATLLARRLIRNREEVEKTHDRRLPLYDSVGAHLGTGTAANKLGASSQVCVPALIIFTTLRKKCLSCWREAERCGSPVSNWRSKVATLFLSRPARNTRTKSSIRDRAAEISFRQHP